MENCCEFSRKIFINQIQKKTVFIEVEANDDERKLLAERFFIPELLGLKCHYQLDYFHGGNIRVQGKMNSSLIQECVVSMEHFLVHMNEAFELLLMPASQVDAKLEELEDPDVIPYDKDFIDIGEVTAQQFALLLDPYPHKPEVTEAFILQDQDDDGQGIECEKRNPFEILGKLKK